MLISRDRWVMRRRSIQPGDIVNANKKNRLFHANVVGVSQRQCVVAAKLLGETSHGLVIFTS